MMHVVKEVGTTCFLYNYMVIILYELTFISNQVSLQFINFSILNIYLSFLIYYMSTVMIDSLSFLFICVYKLIVIKNSQQFNNIRYQFILFDIFNLISIIRWLFT